MIGRGYAAFGAILFTVAAACTGGPDPQLPSPSGPTESIPLGGTLRVVVPVSSFALLPTQDPGMLDPQKTPTVASEMYGVVRCCLARTLLSHNGRSTAEGGSELHPDLAASLPEIAPDGLTWTFTLKKGLRYGPPLNDVEITAPDFVRAFHRLLTSRVDPDGYGSLLFADVDGAGEYARGEADSISGLETPDDHTLVIRLTRPAGDLGARLAIPLVSPLPPNTLDPDAPFGVAQGHDDGYGRFLVSSGPYMVEGSERLDFGVPPPDQVPLPGLVPGESLSLVKNPSWDPGTDDLRPAYPDRIQLVVVDSLDTALAALDAGRTDLVWNYTSPPTVPPAVVAEYRADPSRGHPHVNSIDTVRGIAMNLAVPPFDDIHVRRALSYAIDKQRLVQIHGGPLAAGVAGHMAPDSVEANLLLDYDPYATAEHRGDVAAARDEMADSGYDTDGDGRCDATSCRNLRAITRDPYGPIARAVGGDLRAIGITLQVDVLDVGGFFETFADPRQRVPLAVGIGWQKGYVSASSFFYEQFYGPVAITQNSANGSLVGATPEQLSGWGYGEGVETPSIDDRIEACLPLAGTAAFECWAALDQYVMQNVVPWVPYAFDKFVALTSTRVVNYSFDQLSLTPALDRIAVSG
jgi:peptide/nickel transport system substrate-binding protein